MTPIHALAVRNLSVLFISQLVFVSGSIVLVTIGGIAGYQLADNPSLATLPVAIMVVGTALTTVPASLCMRAIGRRWGFCLATLIAAAGAALATVALEYQSFWWFTVATGLIGASLAFSQQFRFAAAESVTPNLVSFAISFILLGSIVGAFLGPELVARSASADPSQPYQQVLRSLIFLYLGALLVLLALKIATGEETEQDAVAPRRLLQVVTQPLFVIAVLAGVIGQGVMVYVMTATPLSMNISEGYSLKETSEVIRAHVIAMYLPSLFSAFLIKYFGLQRVMIVGVICMATCVGFGLAGHELMHYWFALTLLGVGWNFLYVGGTTLLVSTYKNSERFSAQAVNEFSVFGMSAIASLGAGTILHQFGWNPLLYSVLPGLVLMLLALIWMRQFQSTS